MDNTYCIVLNNGQNVQECDATKASQNPIVGPKKNFN